MRSRSRRPSPELPRPLRPASRSSNQTPFIEIGANPFVAAAVEAAMTTFLYDLRHAVRTLRRYPGFCAVVVLTLGLGIGINTATFSVVNAVLFRPLGFPASDRLVAVHENVLARERVRAVSGEGVDDATAT